jgi:hypothetical protein
LVSRSGTAWDDELLLTRARRAPVGFFVADERTVVIAEDAREKLERLSWRSWIAPHQIERHPRCCNERGQLLARRPQREDIRSDLLELQWDLPLSVAGSAAVRPA